MPQPRQRIVFCDCLDCVQQPATTDVAACTSPANEAAARQEPPPKCLMFVLSGVLLPRVVVEDQDSTHGAATLLDSCNLPHLNRAAAQGNLCLLTLRQQDDSSAADCCTELAQLLGGYEERQQGSTPAVTLAERFKGLAASFSSNSSSAQELASSVGMAHSNILNPQGKDGSSGDDADKLGLSGAAGSLAPQLTAAGRNSRHHDNTAAGGGGSSSSSSTLDSFISQQLPDPAEAARRILQELDLQQADAGLDLLAVHVDLHSAMQQQQQPQQEDGSSSASPASTEAAGAAALLGWLDKTLRYLNNSAAFKDAVLLTVLATPGSSQQPAAVPMLAQAGGTPLTLLPSGPHIKQQKQQPLRHVLKPLQSWEQLAGQPLAVSKQRAILCLRRLPGVIRRDDCSRFSLSDCCASSGTLALLADRLLPEVAYKLGRAPKYGA